MLCTGRVSSIHRGIAASRQGIFLHVVQSTSCQAEVLQTARTEDAIR